MCERTLAIYCFIDDFLKSLEHKQDARAQVTDSEVITIVLIAMLYFGGNFEKARLVLRELGLMKRSLNRSRSDGRKLLPLFLSELCYHVAKFSGLEIYVPLDRQMFDINVFEFL
jgi:hypothetical protein